MVWDMRQHHGFKEMTPDDIISTFQLFEESKANATKHLAMHGTSTSKINLALKAKHECDEEESEEEEGDDDCEMVMMLTLMKAHLMRTLLSL